MEQDICEGLWPDYTVTLHKLRIYFDKGKDALNCNGNSLIIAAINLM